jgi:hypothetical protein
LIVAGSVGGRAVQRAVGHPNDGEARRRRLIGAEMHWLSGVVPRAATRTIISGEVIAGFGAGDADAYKYR